MMKVYLELSPYVFESRELPLADAKELFDKIRLSRRSTEGLWLLRRGSEEHKRFIREHRDHRYMDMESTSYADD